LLITPKTALIDQNMGITIHQSRPDIYLGAKFDVTFVKDGKKQTGTAVEIDAGVAWVEKPMPTGGAAPDIPPGWKAYIRISDQDSSNNPPGGPGQPTLEGAELQVIDAATNAPWRRTVLNEFDLEFCINPNGSATIKVLSDELVNNVMKSVSNSSTKPVGWPKEKNDSTRIRSDVIAGMVVKRNVAITQSKGIHYGLPDPSPFPGNMPIAVGGEINSLGVKVMNVKVAKIYQDSTGQLKLRPEESMSNVQKKEGFFIPSGVNLGVNPPETPWVISLRPISGSVPVRGTDEKGTPTGGNAFYDNEIIDIRLKKKPTDINAGPTQKGK
jgi:hypothetical protein